jgi:hypothetical protein
LSKKPLFFRDFSMFLRFLRGDKPWHDRAHFGHFSYSQTVFGARPGERQDPRGRRHQSRWPAAPGHRRPSPLGRATWRSQPRGRIPGNLDSGPG